MLKVTFTIEGEELTDDVKLNKENLRTAVLNLFDEKHSSNYWRSYSTVHDLEIEEVEPTETSSS